MTSENFQQIAKVAIVPGNGCGDIADCNWYAYVHDELSLFLDPSRVFMRNMPDARLAREKFWIPFMRDTLKCDQHSIIVGHSSGALAAVRFAEKYPVAGLVLVGAYVSDLGDETERASGYFDRPWQWDEVKKNAGFVVQFGSEDDPFLPWDEQKEVATNLGADLKGYKDRGHFMTRTFPEVVDVVKQRIKNVM